MKFTIYITLLSLVIGINISLAHAQTQSPIQGFVFLPADSRELANYRDSLPRAINFVNEGSQSLYRKIAASSRLDEAQKKHLLDKTDYYRKNLPDQLRNMQFAVSTNAESEALCEKGGYSLVFVVDAHPNIVFVCEKIREFMRYRSSNNLNSFAQVMIHESVHLANFSGECDATDVEFAIMTNTRMGVQTTLNRDGYINECARELRAYASIPAKRGFERSPNTNRKRPTSSPGRSKN